MLKAVGGVVAAVLIFWLTNGLLDWIHSRSKGHMSALEENTNRGGSDIRDAQVATIGDCMQACLDEASCQAVTFTKSSHQCWMKSTVPLRTFNPLYTSAVKIP